MKYQEVLKRHFKGSFRLVKTRKGLTNTIYKAYYNNSSFSVRIPCDDHHLIVNELHEKEVLQVIEKSDLDVTQVFYDDTTRIRITKWVPYIKEFKDYHYPDRYLKVAALLKKLHQLPVGKLDVQFSPIKMIERYRLQQGQPLYDTNSFDYIIEAIKGMTYTSCLCHNDLVSGNLLLSRSKDYLIDYEYAGLNDPLFDLMSFITENNLVDPKIRHQFYVAYFGKEPDQHTLTKLLNYERFHNLLWLYWSTMMYNNRHEDLYKRIAKEKYEALLTSITKEN